MLPVHQFEAYLSEGVTRVLFGMPEAVEIHTLSPAHL